MPQWFRFYSETTTDRKIDRICRATGQPKMAIIGAWSILMSIASDSPIRGALLLTEDHPFTLEDLAAELGADDDLAEQILGQFIGFRMVHQADGVYYLTNWDKRQFASDDSAERVRRYRERQKEQTEQDSHGECNDDVTLQDRDGNAPETETETESETEIAAAGASEPPKQKPTRTKDPPPAAVQRFREATERYPKKTLWPGIVQTVGDTDESLERWHKTCMAWVAMGWNPVNVKGMLQHFVEHRIPGDDNGKPRAGPYDQRSQNIPELEAYQ